MTIEDFTTYTESDPSNRLSQTAIRSTFTNLYRTDDNTYLWKNKSGDLQDFILYFTFKISAIDSDTPTIRLMAFSVVDNRDDYTDNRLANETQFGLQIRSASSTTKYWFVAFETWVGSLYTTAGAVDSKNVGTEYYVKITKSGTSLNIRTYSDAEYTNQIESLNLTLHADHNLTYLLVPQSAKLATAIKATGYVENLRDALDGSKDLFAEFSIAALNDASQDLKATFEVLQGSQSLYSRFYVMQGVDLVGPINVTTSDYTAAIRYAVQRLSVFMAGRYWLFYIHNGIFRYRTSSDGLTWTSSTQIGEIDGSGMACVYFDGTYIHYARVRSQALYYRRGIPSMDGSITWSAAEQTVYDNAPVGGFLHMSINVLSGGYPAISYARDDGAEYLPRVMISDNNDGTWSGSESETTLNGTNDTSWGTSLHKLGSGLYVLYGRDENNILAQEYSGGSWQGEEDTGYDSQGGVLWAAVEINGEIHVAYIDDDTLDIYHGYRNSGGVWQAAASVQAANDPARATEICVTANSIYIFWVDVDEQAVFYRKSTDNGSTWKDEAGNDTPQKFLDSPEEVYGYDIQVYEKIMGAHTGIMWRGGTSDPYTIYFADMGPLEGTPGDLFSDFILQKGGTTALFTKFQIPFNQSKDLPAEFIIRQAASSDLHCFFHVGQDSRQLFSETIIRHTATPIEIDAEFIVRHATYSDLHNFFHVGQDSELIKTLTLVSGIGCILKGEYVF